MEAQILSRKMIKPSSPTPTSLRNLKLSPLDQLPPAVKASSIFYFPGSNGNSGDEILEKCNRLETSLAEILSLFYPLAGRYMKETHSVDCNDEGVEYLEAKVEGQLAQLLSRRDEVVEDVIHLAGGEYTTPLATVQTTMFDCGGLAIGIRISHTLVDGFTAANFITAWGTASREGMNNVIRPRFDLASFFPQKDLPILKQPPPPPKIYGSNSISTRRFVFDGAKISTLKAMASDSSSKPGPSRVVAVTALIWRALMGISQVKHGRLRTSIVVHSVNLHRKTSPAIPDSCCGNLYKLVAARFEAEKSGTKLPDLADLVRLIRDALSTETIAVDDVLPTVIKSFNEVNLELSKEGVDVYMFTSICRLPFNEVDFGWGKPAWVTRTSTPVELISLQDSTGCGDHGVEAWVSLNKQDMLQLQQDPDIIAFTSNSIIL